MRDFWQFFLTTVICIVVMAGCALAPMPQREPITFDYAPITEAVPGSAKVTFVVVGTQLAKPAQQNAALALSNVQVPLFDDFANTMTNDFMEVLNARGFGVTGPYKTYDEIIHPVKEGNDLLLTTEVNIVTNTRNISIEKADGPLFDPTQYYALTGSVNVICDVKLVLLEPLTNEPMWIKNVTLDPFEVAMDSTYPLYTHTSLSALASQYGKLPARQLDSITYETYRTQVFPNCPIGVFLQRDNDFYNNFGRTLKEQYKDILDVVYTYLDPKEIAIVKNQAMELRKRKVY